MQQQVLVRGFNQWRLFLASPRIELQQAGMEHQSARLPLLRTVRTSHPLIMQGLNERVSRRYMVTGFNMWMTWLLEVQTLRNLENQIGKYHASIGFQVWRSFADDVGVLQSLDAQIKVERRPLDAQS